MDWLVLELLAPLELADPLPPWVSAELLVLVLVLLPEPEPAPDEADADADEDADADDALLLDALATTTTGPPP